MSENTVYAPREVSKAAQGSFKDVDIDKGEGVIAFATYKSRDRDKDRANKGMFTKSWQEFKDVRLFKNHDKTQAPGKIVKLWDDDDHAYAHVKFGSSTLGQDTLKDIDEGIITDSSYLFVPIPGKFKALPGGGNDYFEVFHKEVSVLTHWGAHPESKIKAIQKSVEDGFALSDVLKELSNSELTYLRALIANQGDVLVSMTQFAATLPENSDLYTQINYTVAELSRSIADFKYNVRWYGPKQKSESDEAVEYIAKMERYIRNSTASDEHLKELENDLKILKSLVSNNPVGTHSSPESTGEQQKGKLDAMIELQLLQLLD